MESLNLLPIVTNEVILEKIHFIRGQKVMLDRDLAELYGVTTKRLNEQVKRNLNKFPGHFMFELTQDEVDALRSHFVNSLKPDYNLNIRELDVIDRVLSNIWVTKKA